MSNAMQLLFRWLKNRQSCTFAPGYYYDPLCARLQGYQRSRRSTGFWSLSGYWHRGVLTPSALGGDVSACRPCIRFSRHARLACRTRQSSHTRVSDCARPKCRDRLSWSMPAHLVALLLLSLTLSSSPHDVHTRLFYVMSTHDVWTWRLHATSPGDFYNWCLHMTSTHNVYTWRLHATSTRDVSMWRARCLRWCLHMTSLHNVYTWHLRTTSTHDVSAWRLHTMSSCDVSKWRLHMTSPHDVYTWRLQVMSTHDVTARRLPMTSPHDVHDVSDDDASRFHRLKLFLSPV